jgi:transcriptional regulator GlxA family with amidase domain
MFIARFRNPGPPGTINVSMSIFSANEACGRKTTPDSTANGRDVNPTLFTVGESKSPVTMTGGLRVVPNHTFADAPHADIVVVGAQRGARALPEWLRARVRDSRVVMSVCTGVFKLADAGLLDGKKATTHHEFWDAFAKKFPQAQLERGSRFVQSDEIIYSAGGLTSGIDLALHIVEKFYGREVADRTAAYMEYSRRGSDNGGATDSQ